MGNRIKISIRVASKSLPHFCEKNRDFKFFATMDTRNNLCFDCHFFRELVVYQIFSLNVGFNHSRIDESFTHLFFLRGISQLGFGVSFAIFNSYPLMILLLAGVVWHNSYFLVLLGLAFFIYGNYTEKITTNNNENFGYGIVMILLAALTEAFIYFLVRRIKTTNHWNHVFISYFLGAVIMTAYMVYNYKDLDETVDKSRVGLAVIINGIIGTVGYFLRFYSSYRLEPDVYAPLSYFGVVMSYVYGMLFDNELLNWKKVLGTVSILASNYFAPKGV